MNDLFIQDIRKINQKIITCHASLKNLNTMKIDGKVKYLIKPTTFLETKKVLQVIKNYHIPYHIIGNGSNILFTNKEKECIVKLAFSFKHPLNILLANELIPVIAEKFLKNNYKGLEYMSMIPASIGGAIVMNAGSYNHHLSDIIEYVYYLDENLNFKTINKENCCFQYRNSLFKNSSKIVLGCKVKLINESNEILKKVMHECSLLRKNSQPLEYPNSGSIFKNPFKYKAWELIEKVNLKGYKKNGAMISEKHGNFIVNYHLAKYEDILYLIKIIEEKVKKEFNIDLEREIIIID